MQILTIGVIFFALADTIMFHFQSWVFLCDWIPLKVTGGWFLSDGWHFSKTMAIFFFILSIISEHVNEFKEDKGEIFVNIITIVFYLIVLIVLYAIIHVLFFNLIFNL